MTPAMMVNSFTEHWQNIFLPKHLEARENLENNFERTKFMFAWLLQMTLLWIGNTSNILILKLIYHRLSMTMIWSSWRNWIWWNQLTYNWWKYQRRPSRTNLDLWIFTRKFWRLLDQAWTMKLWKRCVHLQISPNLKSLYYMTISISIHVEKSTIVSSLFQCIDIIVQYCKVIVNLFNLIKFIFISLSLRSTK